MPTIAPPAASTPTTAATLIAALSAARDSHSSTAGSSQRPQATTIPSAAHSLLSSQSPWPYCSQALILGWITKGGGIHRMKLHLAGVKGDIGPCKSVPPDVRFHMENSLQEFVNAKKATKEADEYRNPYGPNVSQFEGDMTEGEEEVQEMQSRMAASSGKRKKSTVDKYFAPRNIEGAQPSMRSVLAGRYKGPNYYQLRINLLKDAKKEVQLLVDSYRAIWAKVGCTIMGDGWTDNRQRTLINFLVYCPEGISFVKSVDATNLFQLFDEVIEWVGPLNVVHVVTDNAANYVAAGRLISQKHKHINWSPCAAHCLNLIFKDIGKIDHVTELVRRASKCDRWEEGGFPAARGEEEGGGGWLFRRRVWTGGFLG
ncbi:uncharacterized protein LOC117905996 [Vitis riparia]|uniref:uncharacterized protein LOC117905996 n=1 Tax=Vitis riparia TaxID=96939 RepID=UPI00155A2821|nr:uncharacterized protein LOC117905996 [Vitis riparia]